MIKVINNVTEVSFSPVDAVDNSSDSIEQIAQIFKFTRKESELIVDFISYIRANARNCRYGKKSVIRHLEERFKKEYIVSYHYYNFNNFLFFIIYFQRNLKKNFEKFDKSFITSNNLKKESDTFKEEFLNMAVTIIRKLTDDMTVTEVV